MLSVSRWLLQGSEKVLQQKERPIRLLKYYPGPIQVIGEFFLRVLNIQTGVLFDVLTEEFRESEQLVLHVFGELRLNEEQMYHCHIFTVKREGISIAIEFVLKFISVYLDGGRHYVKYCLLFFT